MKNNRGITLIALVITIIVILVLAGVTISLVGDNGIIAKANLAKLKTEMAQYEEELKMCVLIMQTESQGNLNMESIIKTLPTYIEKVQNTKDYDWDVNQTTENPEGIYKGYSFYIDNNGVPHIKEQSVQTILSYEVTPNELTNQNVDVKITIKNDNGIQTVQLEGEKEIQVNGKKEYVINKEGIDKNITYQYNILDTEGNREIKIVEITNIDRLPPKDFTPKVTPTRDGFVIEAQTEDQDATVDYAKSGMDRYEYIVGTQTYTTTDTSIEVTGLQEETEYEIIVKAYDKVGNYTEKNMGIYELQATQRYLYKEGNQYENITGGWEIAIQQSHSNVTIGNDYMSISTSYTEDNVSYIATKNYLDLTNYNSLHILANNSRIENVALFGLREIGTTEQISQVEDRRALFDDSGIQKEYVLNIEKFTGNAQITFGGGTNLMVYKVWLE